MINNEVGLNPSIIIYRRNGEWPGLKKESNLGRNKEVECKGTQMSYCGVMSYYLNVALGKIERDVKI